VLLFRTEERRSDGQQKKAQFDFWNAAVAVRCRCGGIHPVDRNRDRCLQRPGREQSARKPAIAEYRSAETTAAHPGSPFLIQSYFLNTHFVILPNMLETLPVIIEAFLGVHITLAPVILILFRTASIILAPIPGTPIDLLNIALFGKVYGFIYAVISIVAGGMINFWIGRRFREPVLKSFIPLDKIQIWEERLQEKTGFWGLVFIRMMTIPIFDYLSYVAGLTKMSYWRFFITSLIASIPPTAAFYYFGGVFLERGFYWALILIIPVTVIYFLFQQGKIFKKFSEYLKISQK
jgi:uncharacterized membrane protein YdjX (TVP38/TMEM64 family)